MRFSRGKRRMAPVAAAAAMALIIVACGAGEEAATQPEAATEDDESPDVDETGEDENGEGEPSGDPIVLGGTLGLSGILADASGHYLETYELWAEQVNESGGLLGRPVEVLVYDDESDATAVRGFYERLLQEDDVDLLMGPYATFMTLPVIPLVEESEMVMWMAGAVSVASNRSSDWLVSSYTYQDDDFALGFFEMLDDLPDDQKPERLGVLALQNPYTLNMMNGVEGEGGILNMAEERGYEVVLAEEYAPDTTDYSPLIRSAEEADVDALIVANLLGDGLEIARAVNERGFNPDILCMCGSQVTLLEPWAGLGDAGERVFGTTMAWHTDNYPGYDELEQHFADMGVSPLPTYALAAYTALQVAEQAVRETGTLDQAALRDYVMGGAVFDTVVGEVQFDEDGIPGWDSIMLQVQDGENEVVWPADRATSEPRFPLVTE